MVEAQGDGHVLAVDDVMGEPSGQAAAGRLPEGVLVRPQRGEKLVRGTGTVTPGDPVGHPVEVAPGPGHLGCEPPGRGAQGHQDVGGHLADPPARAQAGLVPGLGREGGQQFGELAAVPGDHGRQPGVVGAAHRVSRAVSWARWAAKRSSEVANPAWASGRRNGPGTLVWCMCTSVRPPPRSLKVAVTVMPLYVSAQTSRSGSTTSTEVARVGYSLPSASLTMTVSNTPPGRGSTRMRSTGALVPAGPQNRVR